ncbi:MAG: glycine cleavage system protein GcvH [Streptosporangiales bacterium]|nr:glycine cleavage system protein GcvH [Streptosporangiales bacterium]
MSVPAELGYTKEHEWVAVTEGLATVGITAHAAEALGDVVFVDPPEVGATVTAGEACGEIESTKSVSDIYAPVSGEVTEVNTAAVHDPSLIGTDPYGAGWLFKVRVDGEPAGLLSAEEYAKLTDGEG